MNQTNIRYNLFRNIGVRVVLNELNQFDLGRKVILAVKEYHRSAGEVEKLPLEDEKAWPVLAHELAWKYFNEHDAIPAEFVAKLRRMMRKYNIPSGRIYQVYAGRVYTDARARLILRDLRGRGV